MKHGLECFSSQSKQKLKKGEVKSKSTGIPITIGYPNFYHSHDTVCFNLLNY